MESVLLFPLRFVNFAVGFLAYIMERGADWVTGVRKKTQYVREGSCKRCGRCCKMIALLVPKGVSKRGWLVGIFRIWHRLAMNFRLVGEEEGWLVYRCGYYKDDDVGAGHCGIYAFRHRICRFFPGQNLYGHPGLHPDCGFRFIRRDVACRIRQASSSGKAVFFKIMNQKRKLSAEELSDAKFNKEPFSNLDRRKL